MNEIMEFLFPHLLPCILLGAVVFLLAPERTSCFTILLPLPLKSATARSFQQLYAQPGNVADDYHRDGRVLGPEYFKSVYERSQHDDVVNNDDTGDKKKKNDNNAVEARTPWDIGGPQPNIVRAYKEGKLRGRIIDAGCGKGENSIYLAGKYGVSSVVGFDLAPSAIEIAMDRVARITGTTDDNNNNHNSNEKEDEEALLALRTPFWTTPQFLVASCTEIADQYKKEALVSSSSSSSSKESSSSVLFDVSIDSGLLHCLSDEDAFQYVTQMAQLVKPDTGRAYVCCFSTANPDPWDNPRRLSEEYLRNLFCQENGWEVLSVQDAWLSRPPGRGSRQGAFSMALWMEARRLPSLS